MIKPIRKLTSARNSRMSPLELRTLAAEVRSRGKDDDAAVESVAAALESVSKRRARQPWRDFCNAAMVLLHHMASRSWMRVDALRGWSPLGRTSGGRASGADSPAPQARPSTKLRGRTVDLSPAALKQAFWSVANGRGLQPDLCEALIQHGWVEWRDHTDFTPLDETHPRSALIMTPAGEQQYRQLCAMVVY